MDRVERVRYIADLDRNVRESRREHLTMLEELENGSGLDLDVYAVVYGKTALDGMNETAVKLRQNWAEFLTALKSDHRYTAVMLPYQISPNSYALGVEPWYSVGVNVVVIDGTAEVLAVSASETEASYVAQGDRILYWHDSELVVQTTAELAHTGDSAQYVRDGDEEPKRILGSDSKIIIADDMHDLCTHLNHALNEAQRSDPYFSNPYFKIVTALHDYDESQTQKELV